LSICPSCQTAVAADDAFCSNCGAGLTSVSADATDAADAAPTVLAPPPAAEPVPPVMPAVVVAPPPAAGPIPTATPAQPVQTVSASQPAAFGPTVQAAAQGWADGARRWWNAPASQEELDRRRLISSRIFIGAGVALLISLFLPWVSVLGLVGVGLSGGYVILVLLLAGVLAGEGYLVHNNRVDRRLFIAAWVVNGVMILAVYLIFHALSPAAGIINPGSGLYVATVGVLVSVAATVQLHRSQIRPAVSAPPAGAQMSPDGHWWWDGENWRELK
jgi:hypothetical protein